VSNTIIPTPPTHDPGSLPPLNPFTLPIFNLIGPAILDLFSYFDTFILDQAVQTQAVVTVENCDQNRTLNATLTYALSELNKTGNMPIILEPGTARNVTLSFKVPVETYEDRIYNLTVTLDYRDPETGQPHTESKTTQILVERNYFLMWLQFIILFVLATFAIIVCYLGTWDGGID
jgi:hypothetical protein